MINRSKLPVLILVATISGLTSIVTTKPIAFAQQTSTNLITYINSTYGIKLQYPSNWDKQENGTKQDTQTDVVSFSPPASNSNASLDVSTDNGVKGESITEYSSGSLSDLKQSFKNFKLIESTNTVLAGLPAFRLIFTSENENTITRDMEIGTIKGDTAYLLTYEGGVSEYDKNLPIAQKMIDSFQITK